MTDGPPADGGSVTGGPETDGPPADVLESGPGGSGRWRRPWVLLLVVAAGVALLGLWVAASGDQRPPRSPGAAPTSTPSFSQPAWPTPSPVCCRPGQYRLDGWQGYGPAGVRLLGGGHDPLVLDVHTGRTTPVHWLRLPRGQRLQLYQVGGGRLVGVVSSYNGDLVTAYLRRSSGGTVSLGAFAVAIASRDGGLLAFRPDQPEGEHPPSRLASFTADGQLRWQRLIREPSEVVRDTPHGLLIHVFDDGTSPAGGSMRLVDPRTGVVRRDLGRAISVLASTDRAVAWLGGPCQAEGECPLRVTDLRSGRTTGYPAPLGRTPGVAEFSPDGRLLALGVYGLHESVPGRVRDGFAGVLDLRSRVFTLVPGVSTGVKSVPALGWAPDGQWLLMAVQSNDDQERLAMWRLGAGGVTVLPTVLPGWTLAGGSGLTIQR
jgi:hypothetical protein